MYRIMLLDTNKANNASTYRFHINKYGEIMDYDNLSDLDAAVEELLQIMPKNGVIPIDMIDYTIDANIDTMSV